jgi:hypothetical protein
MKSLLLIPIAILFLASSARAGDIGGNTSGVALGGSNLPPASETCVEVEIGGEHTQKLDCINQQLKQQAQRVQPIGNVPPLDANSPAVKSHGFNETALSQQYGPNLGKSVVPFRPSK